MISSILRKPKKHIYFISIVFSFLIPLFFDLRAYLLGYHIYIPYVLFDILYSFILTFSLYYSIYIVIDYLQARLPWQKNLRKRLFFEFVTIIIVVSIITIIIHESFTYILRNYPHEFHMRTIDVVMIAILLCLVSGSIYEANYLIRQWKKALVETERLKRENIESQYAALKNQVNPHFLFNSLNTLSSLINSSPEKAIDFVSKFSKIYRYVLEINDKILIDIKEEIAFIESYYFLQKIRYGNNLFIEININKQKTNLFIPPLTMQLLIENAIKHNEISTKSPLRINIYCEDMFLYVTNNLKKKNIDEFSTGIGLQNLTKRYSHFSEITPEFFIKNENYIAKVPLIKEN